MLISLVALNISNFMTRYTILFCLAMLQFTFAWSEDADPRLGSAILICEQASSRVMLMDSNVDWSEDKAVIWSWSPLKDAGVMGERKSWFRNIDEAKPVHNGNQLIVTASGGGAALVDYKKAKAIASVYIGGSPHSADRLPDGRIVVASSNGDALSLWDPAVCEILQKLELPDAHGVEWDASRNRLWALGGKQLICLSYHPKNKKPLRVEAVIKLPVTDASKKYPRHGGHDLTRIPGEDAYFVSDMDHLWRFDCKTRTFKALKDKHGMPKVKSISRLGVKGPILVLQATEQWYSTGPQTLDQSKVWKLPKARIYKARWWFPW